MNAIFGPPFPANEAVLGHAPGSAERRALGAQLERMAAEVVETTAYRREASDDLCTRR
jgi:hypothetical protein